jgi:hypothetical protein
MLYEWKMLTSLKMKCAVKYLSLKCVSVLYMCVTHGHQKEEDRITSLHP